jgi:hypothetical protein
VTVPASRDVHRPRNTASRIAAANSAGYSSGAKWPTPSTNLTVMSLKNSSRRSDHARGNRGSCSGHRTVVGTASRWSGAGGCSPMDLATEPAPERYQPIEAVNAPGGLYTETRWARDSSSRVNDGPDQWAQKCHRYSRTASGFPSISAPASGSR